MSRGLIALNAGLLLVALAAGAYTVREYRQSAPAAVVRPAPGPQPSSTAPADTPLAPPGGYAVVASRNLFSPNRSEAPATPAAAAAAAQPRPHLYGIILRDQVPVAYLEDPATKRVAGYRIGDAVAGGTVKVISNDHVVLNRPEGDVNVRLRDPAKPRPAAPPVAAAPGAATPAIPGAPVAPGAAGQPTAAAPGAPVPPGVVQPLPQNPNVLPPLPRRPLPPNLLRRLPPAGNDAPAQN